jgi:DNA-binding Xre family transcriptional regulator
MLLKTRVFDLCPQRYRNLSELAQAMEISVSQVYRVQDGKRKINRKFIIGAIKAFPGCSLDDLFYFVSEVPTGKDDRAAVAGSRRFYGFGEGELERG